MKIGHSSINELGRVAGGKAGDQTGREVCFSTYTKRNYNYVLRAKDKNIAEKIASACEDGCRNDHIGYSQPHRLTLRTQAKLVGMDLSRITKDCECDCSSFVAVCCECAGIPVPYPNGNAITTSNMKIHLMNTGYFDLLTDEKYLNSEKFLQCGDILVVVSSHTIIALEDGVMADISKIETPNEIKAIDLSKYNIVTDYKQMANEISHVIIRVGYRSSTSGNIIEDDLFQKHITNCISNGINNLGIYFYDQSINEIEAVEQADWVINKIKSYNINLPIYIDSEAMPNHTGRADNISKEQRTKNILAFCNRITERNYVAGVYASNSWFKSMVEFDKLKYFNIWCARYSTQKPTISKYDIWQYGSEQFIWAQKPIDVNWIYNLSSNTQKPKNDPVTCEIKGIDNRVKVNDYLNVRNQPLSNAQIVGKLYNNNQIDIYGYVHDWYMITPNMDKWVSSKYITTTQGITTANLNYRESAGDNQKILGVYEKGVTLKLLNKTTYNNEVWYLCLDDTDRFGWCSGRYIK